MKAFVDATVRAALAYPAPGLLTTSLALTPTANITDIAGSSAWFERGFVTYSNAAKTEISFGLCLPVL